MKRIAIILLILLFALFGCTKNNKVDKDTLNLLHKIYDNSNIELDFDDWFNQFETHEVSISDEYTYVIGDVDTNVNVFSYESFEIIGGFWVIDGIKTNVAVNEAPKLNNLYIEYGANGNWVINGYDTNIKIDYRNKKEVIEIEDYFRVYNQGEIPFVSTTDTDFTREFYYYSKKVKSSQSFTSNGVFVGIESPDSLSSYMLQYNDLKKIYPLNIGTKYNISFDVVSNNNTTIAVCLYKNNNSEMYYYEEYNLNEGDETNISFDFICEDPALFLKIYMGKKKASYLFNNFKISFNYLDYIKSEIENCIPNIAYSSFNLPVIDDSDIKIEYETNYSKIENNEFIYIDPNGCEKVNIKVLINYYGKTSQYDIGFKVKSPLTKIPEMYITLNKDKKISETDTYSKMTLDLVEYEGGEHKTLEGVSGGIRVRGNSTRTFSKKPYRIKFDSKQSLFGLTKAKSWVLLANHADQSLMRAYLAHTIANSFNNMDFAPSAHYVDLYVNGVYYGNYLLTEQMQVGKGRVDIESNPGEVNTGYLLEYDFHIDEGEKEGVDYFNIDSSQSVYFIKSPDRSDGLTDEQFAYIKDYISKVDKAIKNRSGYEDLIDIDSFIDFFWMQEIFKNIDCNQGSIYMYKEKDGKLKMGPIWDFDLSAGDDSQDMSAVKTDGWFSFAYYKNQWMYNLMKDKEIAKRFVDRWHEKYEEICEIIETIPEIYDYIEASALANFSIHDVIGKERTWYTVDAVYNIKTYSGQVEYLYNWLTERVEWINNNVDSLK